MDDPTIVLGVETPNDRPAKGVFSLPGLFLLAVVFLGQRKRKRREDEESAGVLR
jgi:hypothetical protein